MVQHLVRLTRVRDAHLHGSGLAGFVRPGHPGWHGREPRPQCADHEYWIHLDDKRWEVRDVQWLTAGLVQNELADPERLAITGGSYGGAPTASAALLADQIMCGADPVPEELGVDPCADAGNGDLVPWTTADGETELTWAAALPLYTFSDLLRVLAPNGRWSDGATTVAPGGSSTSPFGVPLESTVSGLVLAAQAFGSLAPEGADPDSDILTTTSRLLAGDPYDPEDPVVAQGIEVYERFKSPITTDVRGEVPIFWVQGSTDALFPASEALAMVDHLHATDPEYPVKLFVGDIGHDFAAERQDDWDLVKGQMNDFVDHYLQPDRTPDAPVFDVGASVTRCFDPQAEQTYMTAPIWAELADDRLALSSFDGGMTSTAEQGPSGVASDPVSTATLPGDDSYKGCRIMRPAETDPTTATFELALDDEVLLMGAPLVDLEVVATGPDVPVAVRVWDVNEDRSAKALVTRGVYRMEAPAAEGTQIQFLLWPQAYRFEAGHTIQVEVTGNDTPYLLANNQPSDLTIESLELTLPRRTAAADDVEVAPIGGAGPYDESDPLVAVATVVGAALLLGLGGTAVWRWRRRRRQPADVS